MMSAPCAPNDPTDAAILARAAELTALEREAATALRAIAGDRSPEGLTPDHIKRSPEYREAKRRHSAAFAVMRSYNGIFRGTLARLRRDGFTY